MLQLWHDAVFSLFSYFNAIVKFTNDTLSYKNSYVYFIFDISVVHRKLCSLESLGHYDMMDCLQCVILRARIIF